MWETRFNPWVRKIPWRRKWHTTPVFLPGKFRGQRSLVGSSPWTGESMATKSRTQLSGQHIMPLVNCILFHSTGSPAQNRGVIPQVTLLQSEESQTVAASSQGTDLASPTVFLSPFLPPSGMEKVSTSPTRHWQHRMKKLDVFSALPHVLISYR